MSAVTFRYSHTLRVIAFSDSYEIMETPAANLLARGRSDNDMISGFARTLEEAQQWLAKYGDNTRPPRIRDYPVSLGMLYNVLVWAYRHHDILETGRDGDQLYYIRNPDNNVVIGWGEHSPRLTDTLQAQRAVDNNIAFLQDLRQHPHW